VNAGDANCFIRCHTQIAGYAPGIFISINGGGRIALGANACNQWMSQGFLSGTYLVATLIANIWFIVVPFGSYGFFCPSYVGSGYCTNGSTITLTRTSASTTCPNTITVVISW
jgi:hypothetical protein